MNFRKLNHLLIPEKSRDRDRARASLFGRLLSPLFAINDALSYEGRRLLLIVFLVGGAGLDIDQSEVHVLFLALVGVMVGTVLVRPLYRVGFDSFEVELPRRVVANETLVMAVRFRFRSDDSTSALRIEGPFLPWDGRWEHRRVTIPHHEAHGLGSTRSLTVQLGARFSQRGEHHLDPVTAAALTPFRLAQGRTVRAPTPTFVVLPRPANVLAVRELMTDSQEPGAPTRPIHRTGLELATLRPYQLGDSLRHLHVRTWARTGIPHVMLFGDEPIRSQGLFVFAEGAPEPLFEASLELAAGIARFMAQRGGGLDQVVVGARVLRVASPSGTHATDAALDVLATAHRDHAWPTTAELRAAVGKLEWGIAIVSGNLSRANLRALGFPQRFRIVEVVEVSTSGKDTIGRSQIQGSAGLTL